MAGTTGNLGISTLSTSKLPSPDFLVIPTKPNAPISYTFFPSQRPQPPHSNSRYDLIVFVNGLGLPASSWLPCISIVQSNLEASDCPPVLTFDRFGQGLTTARDPLDDGQGYGHDFMDAAKDLHNVVVVIAKEKIGLSAADVEGGNLRVVFVAASIGVPITRLYIQAHPNIASALLCLDSNIASVNYSDFLPNPSSPSFNPALVVAEDCSLPQYIEARSKLTNMFDLHVKNAEAMDRRSGPRLLPHADKPKLVGVDGRGPLLTVVGHDPATFAEMGLERMGTPKSLSMRFTNPYWAKYNKGLTKITDDGRCDGVKIAKGCGHFIQIDDPNFVAQEVTTVLRRLKRHA